MILARLAVLGAVLCSLWFNGSYAYAKASGQMQQIAMVAVALTIDLCKATFLPAASCLWARTNRLAPVVLVALWPLAFAYSLFAGYASVATNRAHATNAASTHAEARARAEADYAAATAALATAKQSLHWSASAACTAPANKYQRQFCTALAPTIEAQQAAAKKLDAMPVVAADPELTLLANLTRLDAATLALVIAFVPACILELVSSLGFYAVYQRPAPEVSEKPAEGFLRRWLGWAPRDRKTPPAPVSVTPAATSTASPQLVWSTLPRS